MFTSILSLFWISRPPPDFAWFWVRGGSGCAWPIGHAQGSPSEIKSARPRWRQTVRRIVPGIVHQWRDAAAVYVLGGVWPQHEFHFVTLAPVSEIQRLTKWLIGWIGLDRVNLIKHLFGRHQQAESTPFPFISWAGQSGTEYLYEIYPIPTPFKPVSGNYIYAKQSENGSWIPIYVAQTRDLHQRLEGHVTVDDAIANGATHVHIHYCTAGQAARCTEERDLILRWQPVCNDAIES